MIIRSVLVIGFALALSWSCVDLVNLTNRASGEDVAVLADGTKDGSFQSDLAYASSTDAVAVGPFEAGSGEVIVFTNRRPVQLEEGVIWTDEHGDEVAVDFPAEIAIPVTVWIVKGPFSTQRDRAIDACVTTAAILSSEHIGLRFSEFEIVDATGDAQASKYFDFDCSMQSGLETDIGKRSGRINVYYVETVDGGSSRGQACSIGSDFVAMGDATGDELLIHELGHDFGLFHIDTLTNFDQTNVMHSASSSRAFITEGQVFRAHLRSNSALNFLYGARPGQPIRECSQSADSSSCPRIDRRLWSDGVAFPAN